jgi:hypothetical protein
MMKAGLGDMFWLNLSNVLFMLAALWLSYQYLAQQTTRRFAFWVLAALAFNHELHTVAVYLVSEPLFMLLAWLGLYCYSRGLKQSGYWLEAGTLALFACCWVRVAGFPLAGAAAVGLVFTRREIGWNRVWANAVALLCVVGVTAICFYLYERRVTSQYPVQSYGGYVGTMAARSNWQWLTQPIFNLWATGRGVLRLLTGQQHNSLSTWLVGLAWIPILVGMIRAMRRRQLLGAACVAGYIGLLCVNQELMARYLLPLAPLLVWYFYEGGQWLLERLPAVNRRRVQIVGVLTLVLLAFNLPHTLAYAYYVHHHEAYRRYPVWAGVHQAARFLQQHARPGERFASSAHQREISYLGGLESARLSSRRFDQCHPAKREYELWLDKGLVFLVKWGELAPQCDAMFEEVCREHGFQRVFRGDSCEIYSTRPLDPRASVRSGLPAGDGLALNHSTKKPMIPPSKRGVADDRGERLSAEGGSGEHP